MFNFQWPWFALLLPLPWVVWRYFSDHKGLASRPEEAEQPILLHPALEHLREGFSPASPGVPPGSWIQLALLACVWGFLVLTLMGPRLLEEQAELASRGHDLMLAIDTSGSMKGMDFTLNGEQVSRMAVVKGVGARFVESRHGDRIGLILFGDQAIMQAPLTLDANAVGQLLRYAEPGLAGDSTAIGDAIALAVKKLMVRPEGSRVLVLVTDGENTAGMAPIEAARLAEKYGVRIYAIGVGSKGKVPFPDAQGHLEYREDLIIDDEGLTRIATMTNGVYFRATDTQGLERIYRDIDALEKTEATTRNTLIPISLYRWPLAAALLFLLVLAWLGLTKPGQREGQEMLTIFRKLVGFIKKLGNFDK
ncbi:Ca-activated chloride channel homolog [Gammaproteobacteria bacterium]